MAYNFSSAVTWGGGSNTGGDFSLYPSWFGKLAPKTTFSYAGTTSPSPPLSYNLKTSTYGATIPIFAGSARLPGRVIWARVERNLEQETQYGGTGTTYLSDTTYLWNPYADVAFSFGYNAIPDVAATLAKLWLNGLEIDLTGLDYTFYGGTEEQLQDPTILAREGAANTSAYRGEAYIVIRGLDLSKFGYTYPAASALLNVDQEGGNWEIYRYDGVPKSNIEYLVALEGAGYEEGVDTFLDSVWTFCWVDSGYLYNMGLEVDSSEPESPINPDSSWHKNNLRILRRPIDSKPDEGVEKWSVVGGVDHQHDYYRWETSPSIDPYTGDVWFSPIVQDHDYPWVRLYCMRKVNNWRIENGYGDCRTQSGFEYSPVGYTATHAVWVQYGYIGGVYSPICWVTKPTSDGPGLVIESSHGYPASGVSDLGYCVDGSGDLWLFAKYSGLPRLYKMPGVGRLGHGTWTDMTPWDVTTYTGIWYPGGAEFHNYSDVHSLYCRNTNRIVISALASKGGGDTYVGRRVHGVYDITAGTWTEKGDSCLLAYDADMNLIPAVTSTEDWRTNSFKVLDTTGNFLNGARFGRLRNHDNEAYIWIAVRLTQAAYSGFYTQTQVAFVRYSAEDWSEPLEIVLDSRYGDNANAIRANLPSGYDTWIDDYSVPAVYTGDNINPPVTDLPDPADTKPNEDPLADYYWHYGWNFAGNWNTPFMEVALTGGVNSSAIGTTLAGSIIGRGTLTRELEPSDFTMVNVDDPITGWIVHENADFKSHLQNDSRLFGFSWFENGDGITCVRAVDGDSYTINRILTEDDLCELDGEPIQIMRGDESEIPSVLNALYIDETVEYQQSRQRARRARYPVPAVRSNRTTELSTPIILDADDALNAATKALFRADVGRIRLRYRLKQHCLDTVPTDIHQLPALKDGRLFVVEVEEAKLNPDFTTDVMAKVLLENESISLTGYSGSMGSVSNAAPRLLTTGAVRPSNRIVAPAITSE